MDDTKLIINIHNIRDAANSRKVDAKKLEPNTVFFFAVSLTIPDTGLTCIIDNFKYSAGSLYPPQKRGNNYYYDTVAFSPLFAEAIKAEVIKLIEDPTAETKTLQWTLPALTRLLGQDSEDEACGIWMSTRKYESDAKQ